MRHELGLILGGLACACCAAAPPAERHLIYFHGKIIEDQGLPAVSEDYGEYQFEEIVRRFEAAGFTVRADLRERGSMATEHAESTARWIKTLIHAGVAPEAITIVGASKGAYIASLVSHRLRTPGVKYVLVAGCAPGVVGYMLDEGVHLYGDVLAIRDSADTDLAGPCAPVFENSPGLGRRAEFVVDEGVGHGLVYQPYDSWFTPAIEWTRQD